MQTTTVNLPEAATHLADLVKRALQGDEIIITEAGAPLVRLVPVAPSDQPRILGLNEGEVWMSDDFGAPLPDSFWLGEA